MEKGISGSLEKSVISLSRRQQGFKSPWGRHQDYQSPANRSWAFFVVIQGLGHPDFMSGQQGCRAPRRSRIAGLGTPQQFQGVSHLRLVPSLFFMTISPHYFLQT